MSADVASLAAVPWADELVDDDALSLRLERPVRVTYVRVKPGRSLTVAWHAQDAHAQKRRGGTGGPRDVGDHGWAAVFVDRDKRDGARRRGERDGTPVTEHESGPAFLLSGPLASDPVLARELARVRARLGPDTQWSVLRYNPRRRVVARVQDPLGTCVLRTAAAGSRALVDTAALWHRLGAPVLPVSPLRATGILDPEAPGTTWSPWWGRGDLFAVPLPAAAWTAGRSIARVHAQALAGPSPRGRADATGAARTVAHAAPWLADRLWHLAMRLQPLLDLPGSRTPSVHLHGDLSPDQILVGEEDAVRVIDLDRACTGPAERDLGAWTAACRLHGQPELIEPFLTGYREERRAWDPAARSSSGVAGTTVSPASVAAWEAYGFLARTIEPFRRLDPEWPVELERRVRLAEAAIGL